MKYFRCPSCRREAISLLQKLFRGVNGMPIKCMYCNKLLVRSDNQASLFALIMTLFLLAFFAVLYLMLEYISLWPLYIYI